MEPRAGKGTGSNLFAKYWGKGKLSGLCSFFGHWGRHQGPLFALSLAVGVRLTTAKSNPLSADRRGEIFALLGVAQGFVFKIYTPKNQKTTAKTVDKWPFLGIKATFRCIKLSTGQKPRTRTRQGCALLIAAKMIGATRTRRATRISTVAIQYRPLAWRQGKDGFAGVGGACQIEGHQPTTVESMRDSR